MKLEKHAPLDLNPTTPGELAVEPDTDLDVPEIGLPASGIEMAPSESRGPLAMAGADFAPATLPHTRGGGPAPQPRRAAVAAPDFGGGLYIAAAIASLLWAAMAVYALGFQPPPVSVEFAPFQTAVFVVFAIAPIGFIWIAAYCVRQGARLAGEVVRTKTMAEDLLEPAAIAATQTGSVVEGIRLEIASAVQAAADARAELLSLRQALAEETGALAKATKHSVNITHELRDKLGRERESLGALTAKLDARATTVEESITRQARMVAEASDLAQTQIGEAEAALAARAADLAGAAADANEAARIASEDLARQAARLETATVGVADQIQAMEDTLTGQRAALVTVAHNVRADHEDFSLQVETQRAQLAEILAHAQLGAAELNEAAGAAMDTMAELAGAAAAQVKEFSEASREERDQLAATALQSLGALSEAAKYEREALESEVGQTLQAMSEAAARERESIEEQVRLRLADLAGAAGEVRDALEADALRSVETMSQAAEHTSKVAEGYNESARKKMEELAEAAFAASQQAEAAFETRLNDAANLIGRSAGLVDMAADKSTGRLEQVAASTQAILSELESAITAFEARVVELPAKTQSQIDQLRSTLSGSFNDLLASARAAAEETQAIDAAFQDRVKRNYEMLSEAVRLMGVVSARPGGSNSLLAGARASQAAAQSEAQLTSQSAAPPPPAGAVASPPPAPAATPPPPRPAGSDDEDAAGRARRPFSFMNRAPSAALAGLRPRLKLSPTSADAEVSQVFEAAADPATPEGGWTWQELLSSMDDAPEAGHLADRLIGEIEALGADTAALLPGARIDEIAAVLAAGDQAGARSVVRHLAPTAVRRLARRLMAERGLRSHAERFVEGHAKAVEAAIARDKAGPGLADLLDSEEGRAFLLFDAALGDLR